MPSLMDLPPEIREFIYEYVAVEDEELEVFGGICEPGLLAVSRQIRHEGLPSFYGSNIFLGMSDDFPRWLDSLDDNRTRMLRAIHIEMEWASSIEYIRATFQACTDRIVSAAGGEAVLAKDAVKFPFDDYRHGMMVDKKTDGGWQWACCSELDGMELAEMDVYENDSIWVFRRELEVSC